MFGSRYHNANRRRLKSVCGDPVSAVGATLHGRLSRNGCSRPWFSLFQCRRLRLDLDRDPVRHDHASCFERLVPAQPPLAAIDERQVEVNGTLRLAAPPSLSDVLLIPLIEGCLRRYSDVAVKVLVTDRHLDLVQDEVDISLRVRPQPASSLVFRRLLSYRHILVAAPAYLVGAEALDELADLTRHRLLGFSKWFDETTWKLSNGSRTERVPAKLWVGINDYAGVIRAAVAGMGVAEIPLIVCHRELSHGHLVPVLVDWRFEEVALSAHYLTRRHPSRIVEPFLGHCVAHAEKVSRSMASPVEPPRRPRRKPEVRTRRTPDALIAGTGARRHRARANRH